VKLVIIIKKFGYKLDTKVKKLKHMCFWMAIGTYNFIFYLKKIYQVQAILSINIFVHVKINNFKLKNDENLRENKLVRGPC
jgi:hypothetical protein